MISSIIAPENHHERGEADVLKIGSLQSFIKSEGPIENYSSDLFDKNEIHKIAILDLRILNLDRNCTNILVTSSMDVDNSSSDGVTDGGSI